MTASNGLARSTRLRLPVCAPLALPSRDRRRPTVHPIYTTRSLTASIPATRWQRQLCSSSAQCSPVVSSSSRAWRLPARRPSTASSVRGERNLSTNSRARFQSTTVPKKRFRVAIIGSGPAGFYSARRLLQHVDDAVVDMYEALPVPFGLARFGVAPDHPEVKKCEETFAEVAASDRFRFYGNVTVGKDVALTDLRAAYDAVLFAYGAARDRTLGIAGEDRLAGIYSARAFVGWYNGSPEYEHLNPDLLAGETAVVIGQGNVALDVARILLSGVDRLRSTDISSNALEMLSKSRVKRVHVVGRRGPMQAAFTIKELRELLTLPEVRFAPFELAGMPTDVKSLPRAKKRIAELMLKYTSQSQADQKVGEKAWSLDFMQSPSAFLSSPDNPHQLSGIEFTKTQYADGADKANESSASVVSTEEKTVMDATLAFRSIGYKSIPIPGMEELEMNFDTRRGIIPNIGGRVITSTGEQLNGLYCTGWVKNGPTGVIATTMADAFGAADTIIEDWTSGAIEHVADREGWQLIKDKVRSRHVSWADWLKIDAEERRRGKLLGKEREKIKSVEEMLSVL